MNSASFFRKLSLGLSFVIAISSCSFNSMFLRPDKYPAGLKQITIQTTNGNLDVNFNGTNHQPVFINGAGGDTVQFPYTIKSVLFNNSNNDTLNGWILKPKNMSAEVTILHLHGNAGSILSQFRSISPLISKGYQIFMFDYSGFGFSQGEATRDNALLDARAALQYLKNQDEFIDTRLIIYGQSFGGHLAAVLADEKEDEIEGVVIEGAFSSSKDIAASRVPFFGRLFVSEGYSAKKSIKNFNKPVLVIHSTDDKVVPFYMGKTIFNAANEPKEFYQIKDCHICGPRYYADSIASKIKTLILNK